MAKPEKKKGPFSLDLSFAVSETYDDNVLQSAQNPESDLVTEGRPGVNVEIGFIPIVKLSGGYNLRYLYYLNHSELNDIFHQFSLDVGLDFSRYKKFKNFRLGTEVDYDPVRIAVTNSGDSGINTTQRLQAALIPGYFMQLTPRLDLDTELRVQRIMYFGEGEPSSAADLLLTLRRRVARRIFFKLGANGTYQKFDNLGTTLIYGLNAGFDVEIFKRLNGGVSAGYQIVELPSGKSGSAITLGVNLEYLLSKRTTITLVGNRSNTVDINGNDFVGTTATFGVRHRVTSRTLIGMDAFYNVASQQSVINNMLLEDNLTTYGGDVRLQYTERWSFSLRAVRDQNGGQLSNNDYTQNRYTLEAKYHFPVKF